MVLDVNLPLATDAGIKKASANLVKASANLEKATANLSAAVGKAVGGPAVLACVALLGGYLLYKIVREVRADNNVKHEVVHRGEPRGGPE